MVVNSIATLLYTMSGEKINHGAQAECVTMSASRKPFFGHIRGQICCRKAVGRKPDRLTRYRALETALYIGIGGGVKVEKRRGEHLFARADSNTTVLLRYVYGGERQGKRGERPGKGNCAGGRFLRRSWFSGTVFALPGTAVRRAFYQAMCETEWLPLTVKV